MILILFANLFQVATVLTACGIETEDECCTDIVKAMYELQQYLPLAVLKPGQPVTVETNSSLQQYLPLAVLKQPPAEQTNEHYYCHVATVLTACGIETLLMLFSFGIFGYRMLQQYLPLAVLKLSKNFRSIYRS